MLPAAGPAAAPPPDAVRSGFIINCSETRYHVVRSAAASLGWAIEDEQPVSAAPDAFRGVELASHLVRPPTPAGYDARRTPQVLWVDRSVVQARVEAVRWHQRLNHYPGMSIIARKAALFKRLMRIRDACSAGLPTAHGDQDAAGTSADALCELRGAIDVYYPLSFSSLSDLPALQRCVEGASATPPYFIVKPNKSCEGRGIRLTRAPLDALTVEERTRKESECLIQRYVDRPLLMEGKKFDLRLYVLLTTVQPPAPRRVSVRSAAAPRDSAVKPASEEQVAASSSLPAALNGVALFVHEEGLVRLCADPYAAPSPANEAHRSAHLTNYKLNKTAPDFAVGACEDGGLTAPVELDSGSKRSFSFLQRFIDELGSHAAVTEAESADGALSTWRRVKRRVDECITLTVLSGLAGLRRELTCAGATRGERGDARNCFELLGFDVMLREGSLTPVLMEVNHSPSLFCETDFDFAVKQRVLRDTLTLVQACAPSQEERRRVDAGRRSAELPWPVAPGTEEALVRSGSVRFTQLLPHYVAPAGEPVTDWSAEERSLQAAMAQTGAQLR